MPKFKYMLLTALLLTGCMTRMDHEDPEAYAVVQKLVDTITSGQRNRIAEMVSLPFWMDGEWQQDIESNTLDVHLSHLRKKLHNVVIRNARNLGWRLEA